MKVVLRTVDEIMWQLGRPENPGPCYSCGAGKYERQFPVDPFPAYAPDVKLVEDLTAECAERFPLTGARQGLFILSHELMTRNNGLTFYDNIYYRDDGVDWTEQYACACGCGKLVEFTEVAHTIVLSGKRIPAHPAMLRYLVAHEYGHAAFNHVRRRLGYADHDEKSLHKKYLEIRGCALPDGKYVGGKWHASPDEVIANDFRLLVMNKEWEFWPHDVPRPEPLSPIAEWWQRARELCAAPAAMKPTEEKRA